MKNKGFTLIELLAVIIIMGIITLLAVPEISNLIDKTNNKAFKSSIEGLIGSVKNEATSKYPADLSYVGNYNINNSKIINSNSFTYEGDLPKEGFFSVDEKGVSSFAIHDENWCAIKNEWDEDFKIIEYVDQGCYLGDYEDCFSFDSDTGFITDYYFDSGYNDSPSTATTLCGPDPKIPSKINNVDVVGIGNYAFLKKSLNSVEIPNSITVIGDFAFDTNNLENLVIPNSVTDISRYAFSRNKLKSVIIPNSVVALGDYAFYENNLTSIEIPDSIMVINQYAFSWNKLTNVTIPSTVTEIGSNAFSVNNLTNIVIPNSVTTIGRGAFNFNDLSNLVLPESVVVIEGFAFANNNLNSVILPNSLTTIRDCAFYINNLENLTIPSSVRTIEENAFAKNSLTELTIPSTVTLIKESAFNENNLPDEQAFISTSGNPSKLISYGGAKRDNVVIPSTFTSIEYKAFWGNQIKSIIIPSSITNIGQESFSYNNLSNITIPSSVTTIGNKALYKGSNSNVNLSSIINSGQKSFYWEMIVNPLVNGKIYSSFVTGTVTNTLGNVTISAN